LVGKTVEQALIEVAEEEELAEIREQQREYEELRNAEVIELQRLEEQERRLRSEKDRRMKQAQESLKLEQDVAQKIAARAFAKAYLQDLVPSVFNNLRDNGYFYDPVEHGIYLITRKLKINLFYFRN
jgi:DNA-directed RNA polymerase specialized sigma54-like protein